MNVDRNIVISILVDSALRFCEEEFTLKSGGRSHWYVDVRSVTLEDDFRRQLALQMAACINVYYPEADAICGVPLGALPLATTIADILHLPLLLVRDQAKEHGTKRRVEKSSDDALYNHVVVIEDVVTTGASVTRVLDALASDGQIPDGVMAVLSRTSPNSALPFLFRTLTTLDELVQRHPVHQDASVA
jgi:orotate phosphoribosyltransferase